MTIERLRVGQGFDVHPFCDPPDPARVLVLGGVRFDDHPGLVGHSDADVIAHACTDALLGPTGIGDIGTLFPETDAALAGADSLRLLATAAARLAEAGWEAISVDCTVVCDQPKLSSHRATMERNLSDAAGAPVTVKGKRTEGMAGLQGGIQSFAVALLRAP